MDHLKSLFALCCFMAALVAGCGSSSYSPSSGGPGSINGTFANAPVVGLSYSCGSYSTVTGAGGGFSCPSGSSSVTFKVGGITICTAPPQTMMTPVSCAQATDSTANASTPSVVAVARFLLSINTTPGSTVTITPAELQAAANQTLSFSNPTPTDAELFFAVRTINPGAMLVSIPTAQTS